MDERQTEVVQLIAKFEGMKLEAYKDSGGIWTIGIGTVKYPSGIRVQIGDTCTVGQAYEYLNDHLIKRVYPAVDALCQENDDVPDTVYVALCSIAYNLGAGILLKDSFTGPMANSDWHALADAFAKYNKIRIGGVLTFSQGLANRREAEIEYFMKA